MSLVLDVQILVNLCAEQETCFFVSQETAFFMGAKDFRPPVHWGHMNMKLCNGFMLYNQGTTAVITDKNLEFKSKKKSF